MTPLPNSSEELLEQIRLMNRVHGALSSSLKREEVHTLILATLTSPSGLNFTRAFLFLFDRQVRTLRGHLAMGPSTREEARRLREEIDAESQALAQIVATLGDLDSDVSFGGTTLGSSSDPMKGLQRSAYWIAMLQQYQPSNPLTERLRTIEQVEGKPASPSQADSSLPRFIDFIRDKEPRRALRTEMRLSETMRELLAEEFAVLPLQTSHGPIGIAVLDHRFSASEAITDADLERLGWFSAQTSLSLENAELFSDVQNAYQALKEVDKLKSNFLSTISHELRTPLTAISGFVHLLVGGKVGPMQPAQLDVLKRVQNHGQHLTNIVNDLIEVAEVRSGGLDDVDIETVDPLMVLMNTLPRLEPRRSARRVSVEPMIDGRVPFVRSNAKLLERIYYHLLDNAIKFSPESGHVEVRYKPVGGSLRIEIVDTGIGIDPERLRHIFDGFYQVDNKLNRTYDGLGIGLSVTKMLLDALRGSIHVESQLGQGSTFSVTFPLANENIDGPPRAT